MYRSQEVCISRPMFIGNFFLFWWVLLPLKIFDTFLTPCIGKGIPIIGHESPWGCGCMGPHTGIYRWLVLRSAIFTPRESHQYSFCRRLTGIQDQSGHEGVKKNPHLSDTQDWTFYRRLSGPQDQSGHEGVKENPHPSNTQDRIQAVQPIVKHHAIWYILF